jgi:hypothetical protein
MPAKKQKFIRNIRHVPVSIRLDTGRKVNLQPRGQRGDTVPVNDEEMQDEKFVGNQDLLFELITESEGKNVIAKQTHNQQAVHPALSTIRSPRGEVYESGVVVEENFTDQGKVVGVVNERGQIERFKAPGAADQELPEVPSEVPPEEMADWLARQKTLEGPEAGLGNIKITKEDVQKSN